MISQNTFNLLKYSHKLTFVMTKNCVLIIIDDNRSAATNAFYALHDTVAPKTQQLLKFVGNSCYIFKAIMLVLHDAKI